MPNPSVGAVLVHKGRIIGEGATSPYGGAHGEVNCFNSVKAEDKPLITDATLYVSLEPCAHQGRTPACALRIIQEGVKHVFVACVDPFAKVAGKGIQLLKEAGIKVVVGLLEAEAKHSHRRFFTYHQKKRPYILLKWAQTADGFFAPETPVQKWITSKYSKRLTHKWRAEESAIMIGGHTALIDDPQLNVRLWHGQNPHRYIIDTSGALLMAERSMKVLSPGVPTSIFSKVNFKTNGIETIKLHSAEPLGIIEQIMAHLYEQQQLSVLVEGGAFTIMQLIKNGYWDEARVLIGDTVCWAEGIKAPEIDRRFLKQEQRLNELDSLRLFRNVD